MLHLLVYEGEISKDENSGEMGKMYSINYENSGKYIDSVSNYGIMTVSYTHLTLPTKLEV